MNFLAHSYFSPKEPLIMLGNLGGDFVKGSKMVGIHPQIAEGVKIHRQIDSFTDTHGLISKSKKIVSNKFGHFSGIVIDMFLDHFLAKKWEIQNSESKKEHINSIYLYGNENFSILPNKFQEVFPIMQKHDWMSHYHSSQGLFMILKQMTRRIGNRAPLFESVELFIQNEQEFSQLFTAFFQAVSKEFDIYPDLEISF